MIRKAIFKLGLAAILALASVSCQPKPQSDRKWHYRPLPLQPKSHQKEQGAIIYSEPGIMAGKQYSIEELICNVNGYSGLNYKARNPHYL